ncbi:DUF99 family protein [Inmirania thermothiophila]|uniref:Uncharacterized protein n=1 Tax=Inmirania thermothiophila TaxID=1750597 RepID=A0A3N1Y6H1_9GAMM|nr:DUF99 family protein [Inmirania thermothiophila]ROR34141.1 hypothetical protein EDC57_0036 [Inmirania thermothiophila]
MKVPSHVVGFDDAPFPRRGAAAVPVVGVLYSGRRLVGVVRGDVARDGDDATEVLARLVGGRFRGHLQAVLLQGIAFAGFNVVDLPELARATGLAVLAVARRAPDLGRIRAALAAVPGGEDKWARIVRAGPMEPLAGVHVQRAGIGRHEAEALVRALQLEGRVPEPLRVAHLVAGGVFRGASRGRA